MSEDFEVPSGLGDAYLETLEAYRTAVRDGNTVPAALNIAGVVPAGFTGAIDPAIVDLINGRMTAEAFGEFAEQKWDELSTQ